MSSSNYEIVLDHYIAALLVIFTMYIIKKIKKRYELKPRPNPLLKNQLKRLNL